MAVNAAPSPVITSLIVSEETGRFLTVSANGQVTANGDISKMRHYNIIIININDSLSISFIII